jgi:uncharacterized membrane protein YdfJ with MMPL/SSD domain
MRDTNETLLLKAWRRASRRRRWYALAAVLALVAVAAAVAVLTQHGGRSEQPLSERGRAVLAMQRALAQENLAIQARLRARAAAERARAAAKP